MFFWPHTLRGICYNPKLHQTCIPGIKPSNLLSFPSHHWTISSKNHSFEGVRTLHHYCPRTHTCWPIRVRVHSHNIAKSGKFHRILVSGPFLNRLTAHRQSPQLLLSLLVYKIRVWGLIAREIMREKKLCPFYQSLFSPIANPFTISLRENWRGEEDMEVVGAWWRGTQNQVQGAVSVSCCKWLFVRLI